MTALPRPHLPPGPHRELVDALHDLHHRAGWPSLRAMAAAVGTSHTTVSKAFSSDSLPSWGILELLVEHLGGDVPTFHQLWLRASAPDARSGSPTVALAGRRTELAAVREHLDGGAGLMVVTGEAGIGKTRLVTTVAGVADVLVVQGNCLPLSAQAPLMPVAEALRSLHDADDGQRLEDALAVAPPYVRESLGRLLPELTPDGDAGDSDDEFSRPRLFAAIAECLSRVHAMSGLGVLVEDVHWADTVTLDLLEHLVAGAAEVPVVATWRLDDPETGDAHRDWWRRVRRLSAVRTLDLPPLTRQESGEQCRLLGLGLDEAAIDSIYDRSRGQPLFTEQLAAHRRGTSDLPAVLTDLLDHRLGQLDEAAHAVTRALGVADRGLTPTVLGAAAGLQADPLVRVLRTLTAAHLLAPPDASGEVQLRHPLLAEAVRRRLVTGEAALVHRALATTLGAEAGAGAAEVAEHWRGACDDEQELAWRIAAARSAGSQWAASQAAEHWLRALEIWPDHRERAGDPLVSRPEAYLAAIDALKDSLQFERAAAMSADADARFPGLEPTMRAEFLRRASVFRTDLDGPEVGLDLVEEAIRLLSGLPVGPSLVRALTRKHQVLIRMGRYAEALDVARETVPAAQVVGERMLQRLLLGHVAWHEAVIDGDFERASATIAGARSLSPGDDPAGDIWLAVIWTDVLLVLGAGSDEVLAAGRDALALAEERGITDFGPILVQYNVVRALIDDGRLAEAGAMLGPASEAEVDLDRVPTVMARALLAMLAGRLDEAARTIEGVCAGSPQPVLDLEWAVVAGVVELWSDRPGKAWSHVEPVLEARADLVPRAQLLPALVTAARAAADLAAAGGVDREALRDQVVRFERRAVTGTTSASAAGRALTATWSAEVARIDGADSVRGWQAAATEWGALGRRHDAAYCRWRAARAALRDGHGTTAGRLLSQAVPDARGHEPLLAAIARTRAGRPAGDEVRS